MGGRNVRRPRRSPDNDPPLLRLSPGQAGPAWRSTAARRDRCVSPHHGWQRRPSVDGAGNRRIAGPINTARAERDLRPSGLRLPHLEYPATSAGGGPPTIFVRSPPDLGTPASVSNVRTSRRLPPDRTRRRVS